MSFLVVKKNLNRCEYKFETAVSLLPYFLIKQDTVITEGKSYFLDSYISSKK